MKPIKKPQRTRIGEVIYDSKFEASIARILQSFLYSHGISIRQHQKILVRKPTKNFPKPRCWNCDFVITYKERSILLEAKGYIDPTFLLKLEMLDTREPELFDNLLIVLPDDHTAPAAWKSFEHQVVKKIMLQNRLNRIFDAIDASLKVPP